jgi:uncharacterized repeat protein (TIGR02543 family)
MGGNTMINFGKCFLVFIALLILIPLDAFSETYTETINFDPTQANISNNIWKHSLSELPQGATIQSAEIKLRVKVWYWGWNINEQNIDIMASDTTAFSLPMDRICELNPSTNPSSSNFYTVTCQLLPDQIEFIENDNQIYIGTNTYGGTYYLDYSTLTVVATQPTKYTLTVNINPESAGGVTLNPLGGVYNDGQLVSLTAYKASGYVFDSWTGDVADTTLTTTTVTMDTDKTVVANFAKDSDNDEMPDSWEEQYGLNPFVNDASDDPDDDGFSNIQEYRANTDPKNPDSHPSKAMPWIPLLLLDD